MAGPIIISILSNHRQAVDGLNQTATAAQRIGSGFRRAAVPAVAALATIAAGAKSTVDAAAEAEQSIGAVESVFKQYAGTVIERSKKAAESIGVSANEYRELSAVTGALLKNSGTPLKEVAGLTEKLTTRAADLAATYGGTTKDAISAVSSLLRGEADPIEQYGVSIKQSDIAARLAAQGLTGLTGSAKKQAEQSARLALLFEQSGDAAGQFARENGTAAQEVQKNAARTADLRAEIGAKLLPAYVKIQGILNTVLTVLSKHQTTVLAVVAVVAALAAGVLLVNGVMAVYGAATAVATGATLVYSAAQRAATAAALGTRIGLLALAVQTTATSVITKAAAAAQWLLNAAMAANPIGLLVVAIAALVVGLVIAYRKSETFRAIVQAAWGAVKAAASALWGAIKAAFNGIKSAISFVGNAIKSYINTFYLGPIRAIIGAAKAVGGAVSSGFNKALGVVRGIGGRVLGALGNVGGLLLGAGRAIITGLINGITGALGALYSKVAGIGSKIKSLKGPLSYDKVMLKPEGAAIIDGLISGIESEETRLYRTVSKISDNLAATRFSVGGVDAKGKAQMIDTLALSATSSSSPGTTVINLNVTAPVGSSPEDIGRGLQKYLDSYNRIGGRARA